MQVNMKYGRSEIRVDVPDHNLADVLTSQEFPPIDNPERAILDALESPIDSPALSELAKNRESATIVISDITRPVPNKLILPPILKIIEDQGVPRDKINILIATGVHRPNEGDELLEMVGSQIVENYRIVNHFSQRPETLINLGQTQNGTPVLINRLYVESDLRVISALIEPHLMAGYSGGRKAICPGLASIETMKIMHGPEILEHPKATVGILEGNPFHVEATKIALMAGVDFSLNVTINDRRQLTGVFAGDMVNAHLAGTKFVEKQTKVTLSEPVDAVIVSSAGYPLDATFYQAIKGVLAAVEVVREGGMVILVAECQEGIGSGPFTDLILKTKNLEQFVRNIYNPKNFVIDQWQLEELAKATRKADVYFYSDKIPYEQQKNLFVNPLRSPNEGIEIVLKKYGEGAKIVAIPDGPYVLAKVA
ncbi:TPA: nickel-dependent lactate racemase [Candidatus Poribacteria bacterium]|nr:nickel-dependent lactate racemase [Candidatus Poribacteria bacterium]HIA66378.1 nickel-dependent lactate racemase [Candidatus Poribacteria bacterium]HIB87609.1 nickel-dependent lactate racemase [Candidatus Poribacteria bacterium]HIC02480.1 nickel-dependent lactate racemase [Candidatus Poribacteria bacterium]HIC19504.1 nickel-dependent lactate racemase [Candidatus Poribacteria bacterium]